jgi:tyrosinase
VSWLGFSLQHGNFDTRRYRFCPHGDWYFLPWHRAYVMMYEIAARVLMKNDSFALPYWNWTEIRTMPEAFANPTYKGKRNPLYIANRNQLVGDNALTDEVVGQYVMDKIYAETVFEKFGTSKNPDQTDTDPKWVTARGGVQGTLESTPHNLVHNRIGAFMPTPGSPRDPIFFMHHTNIDRIWASWNALGRKNTGDPLWTGMSFPDNYIRPDGTSYSVTVNDIQSIAGLGYTYDYLPQPDGRSADPQREQRLLALLHAQPAAAVPGVRNIGSGTALTATALKPLSQSANLPDASLQALAAPPAAGARGTEVYALIRDIEFKNDVRGVRVFVNRPDLTVDVPNTDPHFVRSFTFLEHAANGHGHAAAAGGDVHHGSVLVDLTDTLHRLHGYRRLKRGEVTVQLIPIPASGVVLESVGPVKPSAVEIVTL